MVDYYIKEIYCSLLRDRIKIVKSSKGRAGRMKGGSRYIKTLIKTDRCDGRLRWDGEIVVFNKEDLVCSLPLLECL